MGMGWGGVGNLSAAVVFGFCSGVRWSKGSIGFLFGARLSRTGVSAPHRFYATAADAPTAAPDYDVPRALRHGQLQSVIGAVGNFGHDVHWIEILLHYGLCQAGTEFHSMVLVLVPIPIPIPVLAGKRISAIRGSNFSTASSPSFSPVSPSTSATVVAS